MKFYNRENELLQLRKIEDRSTHVAQMTFMVGRRRIGKTSLLLKAHEDSPHIYLFVAKKSEALLCLEFTEVVKQSLDISFFGEIKTFKDLFGWLMDLSKKQLKKYKKHFTSYSLKDM